MWLYEAWEQNVEWSGVGDGVEWTGVDTPQTVMTTRAPAVLKTSHYQQGGPTDPLDVQILLDDH